MAFRVGSYRELNGFWGYRPGCLRSYEIKNLKQIFLTCYEVMQGVVLDLLSIKSRTSQNSGLSVCVYAGFLNTCEVSETQIT